MPRIRDIPQMANCEIEIMHSLIESQQPTQVLEWGAGGSTLFFPQRHECIESWVSIEHDPAYYREVMERADPKVRVLLLEPPDYWEAVPQAEGGYDFILVDGRHRLECLEVAGDLLAPRGIVVLHDSGRLQYLPGWEHFKRGETLYQGELPREGGGYKHRGIAVLWNGARVPQKGWKRDYQE